MNRYTVRTRSLHYSVSQVFREENGLGSQHKRNFGTELVDDTS
jgi:hypothetical protein